LRRYLNRQRVPVEMQSRCACAAKLSPDGHDRFIVHASAVRLHRIARLQVTVEYEIDVNNADKHKGELELCSGTALVTAARSEHAAAATFGRFALVCVAVTARSLTHCGRLRVCP
jgi:hypothetical protein